MPKLNYLQRISEKVKLPVRFLVDLWFIKALRRLPIYYFDGKLNVGDELNNVLMMSLSKRETYRVRTRFFTHFLPVGSIMSLSSNKSIVFGSGFISPDIPPGKVSFKKILVLRGELSKKVMWNKNGVVFDGPLGDPALLMPMALSPTIEVKYKVGVVPHYLHKSLDIINTLSSKGNVVVIDVQQQVKNFLDDLLQCEYIISSSLHGLILSDAYGIKNLWVKLPGDLKGGDFKFRDYYSTTCSPNGESMVVSNESDLLFILDNVEQMATKKTYQGDLDNLRYSFLRFYEEKY